MRAAGAPGRGIEGAGGAAGGRTCCCFKRWTRSGRGGTTGRAWGCPANGGRTFCGRGAMGDPGVTPGRSMRTVGRGGMGAPGIDEGAAGAGVGAVGVVLLLA